MNWGQNILIAGLRVYQRAISPALAGLFGPTGRCRFEPSCSRYAVEAIQIHGAGRGSALAAWRVCRCHPLSKGGLDPVPHNGFEVQPAFVPHAQFQPEKSQVVHPLLGERDGVRASFSSTSFP